MKSILIIALALFVGFNVSAQEKLPTNVVAEVAAHVGFAPPEMTGTYKFQLLSTGVLQRVNNNNAVKVVGTITLAETAKIQSQIDRVKSDKLKQPKGPLCMDAPSEIMTVQKTDGTNLVIWEKHGCQEYTPKDRHAKKAANSVNKLVDDSSSVDSNL